MRLAQLPCTSQAPASKLPQQVRPHRRQYFFACVVLLTCCIGWIGFAQMSDYKARGTEILAHLNAAIHFYRNATTFEQKIGEPSDTLYRDEAVTLSTQILQLAFQSAKAEAALLHAEQAQAPGAAASPQSDAVSAQQKRMADVATHNQAQIEQLKAEIAKLDQQIPAASAAKRRIQQQQRDTLQGQLDLTQSMQQALNKIVSFADTNTAGASGLSGDITRLELSVPLVSNSASTPAKQLPGAVPSGTSLRGTQGTGIIGQAEVVFDQLSIMHQLDSWMKDNDQLRRQAVKLHDPLVALIRQTIQQGQILAQNSAAANASSQSTAKVDRTRQHAPASPAPSNVVPTQPAPTLQDFEQLATRFKQTSAASVPLSQEMLLLDQSHANLQQWHDSIDREYKDVLRSLMLRVLAIALALGFILLLGEAWRRASVRYVQDLRRRRQLLVIRRFVIGFCMGVVLILGFVTQFSSLATFAGFLTAGIALGLQTILLSVAAYFFIVGRYGVRIGDRISVAGVTGDVIDVGIVRLYVMELAGTGIDLSPTGRIAVFSNAVLFQATTPLFKQIPGTAYGWHEVVVKLNEAANYKAAAEKILATVTAIYQRYRADIERQHGSVERQWDIRILMPKVESHLQYVDAALEVNVRYPVAIHAAAEADAEITQALMALNQSDETVKAAVAGPPLIRSTVKI
ncbi:MAG TPA: mechanosensitive ion channel protein MscS [Acidobacteriaceae bacterium]|jgi:predicted  nucleic acid-binding Zn-ribbon protein|nr:mechanosensitive ion channel protein MscS [Acidobacteriaceae bacterium]